MSKVKRVLLGIGAGVGLFVCAMLLSAFTNWLGTFVFGKLIMLALMVLIVVGAGVNTYRSLDEKDAP